MANQSRPKILIIEDDIFMTELLMRGLRGLNAEIMHAGNGKEGISKAESNPPNLILLDILLPDINGLEVLRQIRQQPGGEEIKVIVLSNISESTEQKEAQALGVADYLVKANTPLPEISQKVKNMLNIE